MLTMESYLRHYKIMPDNISDPDVLVFTWDMLVGYGKSIQSG